MTIHPDSPLAHAYAEIEELRASLASATAALTDERRAYEGLTRRRDELINEVKAAEEAARDYRNLLRDAESYGEIPVERCNQRTDLDKRHAAVVDVYPPLDYAPMGPDIVVVAPESN